MYDKERLEEMVQRLINESKEGTVEWKETASENAMRTNLKGYVLLIHENDQEWGTEHLVSIHNTQGEIIDKFSTYNAEELFAVARRSAKGADKAIDDILGELKRKANDRVPF